MQFSKPNITAKEVNAVTDAVLQGHLVTGVLARRFEQMFTDLFGYPYVVVTNSGTSALHLSLLALGVGLGDEVIVTPYSMVATVNVILAVGATPVFCDIDRQTYNLDPEQLSQHLTPQTKAVLPASIFGVPCDVRRIRQAVPEHVRILEDSIEALGAQTGGHYVGYEADIGTFGFYPNKQITTCEGGVAFSRNPDWIDRVRRLSMHGVMAGDLSYQSMGYNMRLSDVHCAMGIAQLERLPEIMAGREAARLRLDTRFRHLRKQGCHYPDDVPTDFIYGIELPAEVDKETYLGCMTRRYIPCKPYFNCLHRFAHLRGYHTTPLPVAEEVGSRTVALPFHHEISERDVEDIWATHVVACQQAHTGGRE